MFSLAATPCVQAHGLLWHKCDPHVPPGTLVDFTSFSDTLHTVQTANDSNTDSACLYVSTCSLH